MSETSAHSLEDRVGIAVEMIEEPRFASYLARKIFGNFARLLEQDMGFAEINNGLFEKRMAEIEGEDPGTIRSRMSYLRRILEGGRVEGNVTLMARTASRRGRTRFDLLIRDDEGNVEIDTQVCKTRYFTTLEILSGRLTSPDDISFGAKVALSTAVNAMDISPQEAFSRIERMAKKLLTESSSERERRALQQIIRSAKETDRAKK